MPFTKIKEEDMNGKGVQGQPDVPGLSASEMQRKVEEIVRDVTNVAFNRLVDELLADTAAGNIGAKLYGMSAGRTLQAVLTELNNRQNTHAQKKNNPHNVTASQTGAYTKQETNDAINEKMEAIGAGDMTKSEYGGSAPGVVAQADKAAEAANAQTANTLMNHVGGQGHAGDWYAPPGMLAPYAGKTAPEGWLLCDGSAVSRTAYAALFAVIGTTYGVGNGSTTFTLPDLRGRVAAGANASNALASRAGADSKQIARANLPAEKLNLEDNGTWIVDSTQTGSESGKTLQMGTRSGAARLDTNTLGSGTAFDVRQATMYVHYIIKC